MDSNKIRAQELLGELTADDILVANDVYLESLEVLLLFQLSATPYSIIETVFPLVKREELMQKAVHQIVRTNIEQWFSVIALTLEEDTEKTGQFIKYLLFLIYGQLYGAEEQEDGKQYTNKVHRDLYNLRNLFYTICQHTDVESHIREQVFLNAQRFLFSARENTTDAAPVMSDALETLSLLSVVTNDTAMAIYADMVEGGYTMGDTNLAIRYFDSSKRDVDRRGTPVYVVTWHDWITKKPGGVIKTSSPFPGNVALLYRDKGKFVGWDSGPMRLGVMHTSKNDLK